MKKCEKCGSDMAWVGSIASGGLKCLSCEIYAAMDMDCKTVEGDWTEEAARNIAELNAKKGFKQKFAEYIDGEFIDEGD